MASTKRSLSLGGAREPSKRRSSPRLGWLGISVQDRGWIVSKGQRATAVELWFRNEFRSGCSQVDRWRLLFVAASRAS